MKASGNNPEEIGARMKQARIFLGHSQEMLSTLLGGSKRGIQNNESGKSVPGGEVVAGFIGLGINPVWLLTGEGEMLLSDVQPRPALLYDQDTQSSTHNAFDPGMSYHQDVVMHMAGTSAVAMPGTGMAIDESLLDSCLSACRVVHGDEFVKLDASVQIGYATGFYNLLVKMSDQMGGLEKIRRLELSRLVDLLNVFISMGESRKFPPPVYPDGAWF